jgi:tetratricopeptide (TPR) repeat protein
MGKQPRVDLSLSLHKLRAVVGGMHMRSRFVAGLAILLLCAAGRAFAEPETNATDPIQVAGSVYYLHEANGHVRFTFSNDDLLLDLKPDNFDQPRAIRALVLAALKDHRTLVVSVHPTKFTAERNAGLIWFDVRDLTDGAETHQSHAPSQESSPSAAMADGLATHRKFPRRANADFDTALNSRGLSANLRALAYQARASTALQLGQGMHPGPEQDQLFMAGLRDARLWETLSGRSEAEAMAGEFLVELGAYDDALLMLRSSGRPGGLQKAALLRRLGRNEEALTALNYYRAVFGPITSPTFYEQRALTLIRLGRFDEAIQDLAAGLALKPDDAWSHLRLACALGAVGRAPEASVSQKRGLDFLIQTYAPVAHFWQEDQNEQAARDAAVELSRLAVSAPSAPTLSGCPTYGIDVTPTRDRSPLLPAGAPESRP